MNRFLNIDVLFVFFGSLSAFYFPSVFGLRLFEFLCLFFLLFRIRPLKLRFTRIDTIIIMYFLLFILYATFSVLISYASDSSNIYLNQYFGIYFTVLLSVVFFYKLKYRPIFLIKALKFSILIHISFFLIQFFSFYLLGNYIDFIKPITGEVQRNIGGIFGGLSAIRPSGLYGEPASYSLNIIIFNFIVLTYEKRITKLAFISLLTVLFSMSASGIIYLLFYLLFYFLFLNKKSKNKISIIILISLSLIILPKLAFLKIDYLIEKISSFSESSSYQYRIGASFSELSNLDTYTKLFGVGLGNLTIAYSKGSTYSMVLIEQGYLYGSMFFISIFSLLKYFKVKNYNIAFVFIVFFGTHTFSQYQFWFLILSLIILSINSNEQTENI